MANPSRTLFIISDRTGITLENLVRTLLSQFDDQCCDRMVLPFLDTPAKIDAAVREIDAAARDDEAPPVVFSSIVDEGMRAQLRKANAQVFDIFDTYLPQLSAAIGIPSSGHVGRSHGMGDIGAYDRRVEAVNFALNFDDGSRFKGLDKADLILIGVSRCGKTPTCLYLAMQYAVLAANFPLTEDDFMLGGFPEPLRAHRDRLFGLTISPDRLHRIREERRPGSDYASLPRCRQEVSAAENLFRSHAIPFIDSTTVSIEELAIEIMQRVGVERHY
ncbi:pyruvate, water dikinase regulatory protein [Thiosocius teredinicola]|uniref:pyruvate, water dikinase regulatory protein n=1 Tax=Thiosocius teredinicola TaxID=1973002 RepID=UPI000990C7EB